MTFEMKRHGGLGLLTAKDTPMVLMACGSFNPITFLHLRIMELARDHVHSEKLGRVVGGLISPVGDGYRKAGLISATHRREMIKRALSDFSWMFLETWESEQAEYVPTLQVLRHTLQDLQLKLHPEVRVMLVCGQDLFETLLLPQVWDTADVREICQDFGLLVIERDSSSCSFGTLSETRQLLCEQLDLSSPQIHLVTQPVKNDVSATKIRQLIRDNRSVHYLLPQSVIKYISLWRLYQDSLVNQPLETEESMEYWDQLAANLPPLDFKPRTKEESLAKARNSQDQFLSFSSHQKKQLAS